MTFDEQKLHDYLDGRLSDAERVEVEVRMGVDAELASRVDSAREVRDALRGDAAELSPGFYTRARARFEQSAGGGQRAGWRLLSWEFAGLAAAAVLALALFVPGVLRDSESGLEPAMTAPRQEGVFGDAIVEPEAAEAEAGTDESRLREKVAADKDDAEPERLQKKIKSAEPEAPSPSLPRPAPRTEESAGRRDAPDQAAGEQLQAAPAEQEYSPVPPAELKDTGEEFGVSGGKAPVSVAAEPVDELPKGRGAAPRREARASSAEANEQRRAGYLVDTEMDAPGKSKLREELVRRPQVTALARDVAVPGGFLVVDDLAEWNRWLAGPAGDDLAALGTPDPALRLVLIADESGVDCSTVAVLVDERGYFVRHAASTTTGPAFGGCALVLPADGRPVTGNFHD